MLKQNQVNFAEMLGVTAVSQISDELIWSEIVTPQVKAFLGEIQGEPVTRVLETVAGEFPGDEVTNLNGHLLYGGQPGFVRFPYIQTVYKTKYGFLLIKRDGLKFKVTAWVGKRGKLELIYRVSLRDRRYDGTKRANDCSLLDFPYDDPMNAPLSMNGKLVDAKSVELSIYAYMPGSRIVQAGGKRDAQYEEFVRAPYTFVDRPKVFLRHFKRAWDSERAPGQNANPIPDVSGVVPKAFDRLAIGAGYDFIENASSHYHVAMWAVSQGYRYTSAAHAKTLAEFAAGIQRLKDGGMQLTRSQESWVCVVQSLPKEFIPKGLDLNGPKWPQDNIGPANLWMNKPMNERAKLLIPDCVSTGTCREHSGQYKDQPVTLG